MTTSGASSTVIGTRAILLVMLEFLVAAADFWDPLN